MLTEEIVKTLLEKYFEKNDLIFCSAFPINEGGERIMFVQFSCEKGIYYMKVFEDLRLFCESINRKTWVQIENY